MVDSSEVWEACPSVSFFFAHLGAALGVSGDFFPLIGDYLFEGSGLSVVLGELSPISGRSLAWFERETKRMSEVRSSELDTGCRLAVAQSRVIQPFLPLVRLGLFTLSTKSVGWMLIQWPGLRIGFNSLHGFAVISLVLMIGHVISSQVKCASTRLLLPLGLGYPSIPW